MLVAVLVAERSAIRRVKGLRFGREEGWLLERAGNGGRRRETLFVVRRRRMMRLSLVCCVAGIPRGIHRVSPLGGLGSGR